MRNRKKRDRQEQKKARETRNALLSILIIGFALCFVYYFITKPTQQAPNSTTSKSTATDYRKQLTKTCATYLNTTPNTNDWWLKHTDTQDYRQAILLSNALANVEKAVASSKDASPLAGEIARAFPSFYASLYKDGTSVVIAEKVGGRSSYIGKQEICFVSEEELTKNSLPNKLFYYRDWKSVMISCEVWPDPLFSGILMHELGHAYAHKQGDDFRMFTRDWFQEEVTMHELEGAVLDRLTESRYLSAIRKIISAHPDIKDVDALLASVSPSEFLALDQLVGLEHASAEIRGGAAVEHIAMIGFTLIDMNKGSIDDKIKHYRWIVGK